MDDPTAQPPQGPALQARPVQERPRVGIVGAGRVGTALGVALARIGWPVVAVASRDASRRARFLGLVPGSRASVSPGELAALVDLVLLAVPDDVIGDVIDGLRLPEGGAMAHTSGVLPASVLAPALTHRSAIASFHPLVPFADLERAVAAMRGASFAIEGDARLVPVLAEMAVALGGRPVIVPAAGKAAYHAAAVLAAGGFVALLDAIAELARAAGMDEPTTLAVYAPLVHAGLANAASLGIADALTGPVVRGDLRTVGLHLEAIEQLVPAVGDLYRAALLRQIEMARSHEDLDDRQAAGLRDLIEP
jgi:predicted short-subunit dehydrogenase-like oxidoreductase (DUF2520 family)